jgi:hypothetical protein
MTGVMSSDSLEFEALNVKEYKFLHDVMCSLTYNSFLPN